MPKFVTQEEQDIFEVYEKKAEDKINIIGIVYTYIMFS